MSYSFTVKGDTKQATLDAATAAMDNVVAQQPVHEADKDVALAAAASIVALTTELPDHELRLDIAGSIWRRPDNIIGGVSLSVNCSLGVKV